MGEVKLGHQKQVGGGELMRKVTIYADAYILGGLFLYFINWCMI